MIEAKLVVVGGETKTKQVELRLPTVIGRGREVNLTLPHPLVSRRHCELYERNGKLVVKDLGSLNGTFVNNTRIEGEEILEPEQLLTLGTVTFRAVYEVAPVAAEVVQANQTESLTKTVAATSPLSDTDEVEFEPDENDGQPSDADDPVDFRDKETVYDEQKKSSDTDQLDSVVSGMQQESAEAIEANQISVGGESQPPAEPVSLSASNGHEQAGAGAEVAENVVIESEREKLAGDSRGLDSLLKKRPR